MNVDMERFQRIVARERSGDVLIGVDRAFARKFFTDISVADMEAHIGQPPFIQMGITRGALIAAPLCALAACVVAVLAFGWMSLLVVVAGLVVVLFSYTSSARASARLGFLTLLLVGALAPLLYSWSQRELAIALFVLAAWLVRLAYVYSTSQVRALALSSPLAFQWLEPNIVIRDSTGSEQPG